jgi:hypothetical protein
MGSVIATSAFAKALKPGLKKWFKTEYKEHEMECSKIFQIESSSDAYEEDAAMAGFGLAPIKTQSGSVAYDSHQQGYIARYMHVTIGLGYAVTREERDDNKYAKVGKARSRALGFSMRQTKEIIAANVLLRGFNSSYLGGDGVELFSAAHPTLSGTQSNELAVAADISHAALEDLAIQVATAQDDRGHRIRLSPRKLLVPPALMFKAERILKSNMESGTANNDINALRSRSVFPEGVMVHHYMQADPDMFVILTDCPDGLKGYQRRAIEFTDDNDFDTENMRFKATERYSFGWSDWRGAYASPGA